MTQQTDLNLRQIDRIIEMAWEDRTPFKAIEFQFGYTEKAVIKLMRNELKESSFKLWRKRVNKGVSSKHLKKRNAAIGRFKCSRQRAISGNKISKRKFNFISFYCPEFCYFSNCSKCFLNFAHKDVILIDSL